MIGLKHDVSCEIARPETPCRCRCNGKWHGKLRERKLTEWETMNEQMTKDMGGEVGEFITKWEGKTIKCFGICHTEQVMDSFVGYEHDGGLEDKNGKKYWVFFECPECNYGHSFAKMKFFASRK